MNSKMITNLLTLLKKYSTGTKVLVWFLITQVVYLTMLLVTIPKVLTRASEMKLLDMMPTGYDIDYVKMLFENLGQAGREAYLYRQIPLDLIYPLLFSISFSLLLAYILKMITKEGNMVFYLCLLPITAGFFDYLENFGIIRMLVTYPDISIFVAKTTNVFSILKSMFTTLYFIALLVSILILLLKRIKIKRK